ncbi:LLM class F420-dependent oxidoreductase, partial [Streptomyces misionensis]
EAAGRDPGSLRREVRINLGHGQTPQDAARALAEADRLGADGAFLDFMNVADTVPQIFDLAEKTLRLHIG